MLLVPPQKPDIIYSNIPLIEEGITVFVEGNTYALYYEVQHNGEIFTSLKDNNTDIPMQGQTSLSWGYLRKVNYYRMFDDKMSTSTTHSNEIIYEMLTSDIDTVCFFGLDATSVKIELFDLNDNLLFTKEQETYSRLVSDWSRWTVQKPTFKTVAFFREIPYVYEAKIRLTITNVGGIASCSHCVIGTSIDLGATLVSTSPVSSVRNLISKTKQTDGSVLTENSLTYKRVSASVIIDTDRVSDVQNILESYTVTPCLFIADEREGGIEALVVFGYHMDFDLPISLQKSEYSIEIEGVI